MCIKKYMDKLGIIQIYNILIKSEKCMKLINAADKMNVEMKYIDSEKTAYTEYKSEGIAVICVPENGKRDIMMSEIVFELCNAIAQKEFLELRNKVVKGFIKNGHEYAISKLKIELKNKYKTAEIGEELFNQGISIFKGGFFINEYVEFKKQKEAEKIKFRKYIQNKLSKMKEVKFANGGTRGEAYVNEYNDIKIISWLDAQLKIGKVDGFSNNLPQLQFKKHKAGWGYSVPLCSHPENIEETDNKNHKILWIGNNVLKKKLKLT